MSGFFSQAQVWQNNIVPYGTANVEIAPQTTVTVHQQNIDLNMTTANIYGNMVLGHTNTTSVTFSNPTYIYVRPGGTLKDGTSGKRIALAPNSAIYFFPGSQFVGNGTTITKNLLSKRESHENSEVSISDLVSEDGGTTFTDSSELVTANSMLTIVKNGDAEIEGDAHTMGLTETEAGCTPTRKCGIAAATGTTLTTETFQGKFPEKYGSLLMTKGGKVHITPDPNNKIALFEGKIIIEVRGTLDLTRRGLKAIAIVIGCQLNLRNSMQLLTDGDVTLLIYDKATGKYTDSGVRINQNTKPGTYFTVVSNTRISISISGMIIFFQFR